MQKLNEKLQASGKKLGVHIKLDTGMRRVGFLPNEKSIEDIVEISKLENIILEEFSHISHQLMKMTKYLQKNSFQPFTIC